MDEVARDARAEAARVGAACVDWSTAVSGRAWKFGVGGAARAFRDRGVAGGDLADVDRRAGPGEGNRAQVHWPRARRIGIGVRWRRGSVWSGYSPAWRGSESARGVRGSVRNIHLGGGHDLDAEGDDAGFAGNLVGD